MNSCILMAQIVQEPQLRYTSDNLAITEMLVEFPGTRDNDPPSHLKTIAWGNLAEEVHQQFRVGDRVAIEGRLSMSTIERPEGFKEKRAELVAQRIHHLGGEREANSAPAQTAASASTSTPTTNVVSLEKRRSNPSPSPAVQTREPVASQSVKSPPNSYDDLPVDEPEDEIPF